MRDPGTAPGGQLGFIAAAPLVILGMESQTAAMKWLAPVLPAVAFPLAVLFAGCAEPAAESAFTIRKIDSGSRGADGSVRIRLTTPGDLAEADESLVIQFAQIVAKRAATQRQTQIARQRARAVIARERSREARAAGADRTTRDDSPRVAARPGSGPRKVRYLAVVTEKSAPIPGKKVEKSVMIFDTSAQEIVGNNVYDIVSPPRSGTLVRFETYAAEFVGGEW